MRAEVVRESPGRLNRERWSFTLSVECCGKARFRLDSYHKESRENKRKKMWDKKAVYLRIGDTRSLGVAKILVRSETPVWPDVEREARERLIKAIWELPIE